MSGRPVLVTDGDQRATLAVVRSLGKRGIPVVVGENFSPALASVSRYASRAWMYRSPEKSADWITDLVTELRRTSYDLLIPMTDLTWTMVAQYAAEVTPLVTLPLEPSQYLRVTDKADLLEFCARHQIPAPQTWRPRNLDDLESLRSVLTFPIVIKPRRSKTLTPDGWIHGGVRYAATYDELRAHMQSWPEALPWPLLQERIEGDGCGAFVLCRHGEIVALFAHRRLREKPPSGGVSVLSESVPVDPPVAEITARLMKALGWHGLAMVEYKRDRRDNLPKVIEINPRFWGSLQLAVDAGVDFPWLLYQMIAAGKIEPNPAYRTGVRLRWEMGDRDHLLIRMTKSARQLKLPPGAPSRWGVLRDYLSRGDAVDEVTRADDPAPGQYEKRRWWRQLLGRSR